MSLKVLWYDCLESEAYICSNTALDIFYLNGMTSKTNISGETSDITTFCEFGWYQWVYFRNKYVTFHGDKMVIERYCEPSIGVGTALTDKILRKNGQQVHRYTYRALTPDELMNPDEIKACDEFDTAI